MSNQVQYNIDSAQYLGLSYYIIIINILDLYIYIFNAVEFRLRPLGFMEVLQNNNHQAVNKMKWIENRKNTVKNRWDFVGI